MKLIFTLFLALFAHSAFSQLSILSQKHIGGSGEDTPQRIFYTPDSLGYYLVGGSNSNSSGDKSENSRGDSDLWLVKTDLDFNIVWEKTIGGNSYDYPVDMIVSDTALYCVLTTYSTPSFEMNSPHYGESDFWLLKLDLNGNILAQKTYGGTNYEFPIGIFNWNNHLLLAGTSASGVGGTKSQPSKGSFDYWLLEVDPSDLSVLTEKVIGSAGADFLGSAVVTDNQELFLTGYASYGASGDKTDVGYGSTDVWIVKLDAGLNIVSDKCFGGSDLESPRDIIIDGTNLYVVVSSYSGATGNKTTPNYGFADSWMLKLDTDMNIEWQKSYGGTDDDSPYGLSLLENQILAVGINSKSAQNTGNKTTVSYGGNDAWLVLTDISGQELAQFTLGGSLDDIGSIAFQRGDTLIFAGSTSSSISGNQTTGTYGGADEWLVKLKITDLSTPNHGVQASELHVYPNPANDLVMFEFPSVQDRDQYISVFSGDGKKVDEMVVPAGAGSGIWHPACGSGIYYYSTGGLQGKIVLQK
ncbi:hypothetical protein [Fluviicola sp.]|jgi:hypothetical protein|uniref:hypothetical protein n=1 Tax=Fluviicola sp. TaxID=1917219 RepID=UPI0028331270|nr:hypothetical protein [Fluviicola sp.]MDR0802202.1 hypothetical protein [Fluviicola sp.]